MKINQKPKNSDKREATELFEKGRSTITEHLKRIFEDGELDEISVCRDFRHTAEDGKNCSTKYYNLKAIIGKTAVGIIKLLSDAKKKNMGVVR